MNGYSPNFGFALSPWCSRFLALADLMARTLTLALSYFPAHLAYLELSNFMVNAVIAVPAWSMAGSVSLALSLFPARSSQMALSHPMAHSHDMARAPITRFALLIWCNSLLLARSPHVVLLAYLARSLLAVPSVLLAGSLLMALSALAARSFLLVPACRMARS
jgi:hypothetical protein